jgi:hypothetical protein
MGPWPPQSAKATPGSTATAATDRGSAVITASVTAARLFLERDAIAFIHHLVIRGGGALRTRQRTPIDPMVPRVTVVRKAQMVRTP